MNLHTWAVKWGISMEAFRDLQITLGTFTPPIEATEHAASYEGKSEAFVQSLVRIEASRKGVKLWRNNVGALIPKGSQRPVRYGLANDSEQMNDVIKSGDLIGIRPVMIQHHHVGRVLGQFVSREIKAPGHQFNANDPHQAAQMAWANVINAHGGDACITDREGTL